MNQVIVVQVFYRLYISVSINLEKVFAHVYQFITVQLILESKYKKVVKEVLFTIKHKILKAQNQLYHDIKVAHITSRKLTKERQFVKISYQYIHP